MNEDQNRSEPPETETDPLNGQPQNRYPPINPNNSQGEPPETKERSYTGLIVGVVAGIVVLFAALVGINLLSFNNLNTQARDTQRKAELDTIQTALESYYFEAETYPTAHQLEDQAWRREHLSVERDVFVAPSGKTLNNGGYTYVPSPQDCRGTKEKPCADYKLTTQFEAEEEAYTLRAQSL